MHPELFSIQLWGYDWMVASYNFFYCVAILFVLIGSFASTVNHGFSRYASTFMLFSMTFGGFFGARSLHYIFNPSIYLSGQKSLWDLHMTGFTIVGGLFGAMCVGFVVGKILRIDLWRFADRVTPYMAFGIVIARIGCFLNGCCFGHLSDMPWSITFPFMSEAHKYQLSHSIGTIFAVAPVHPTQIYEMIAAGSGGIIALIIMHKKIFAGAAVLFFGVWFSIFRLINLFFRQMPDSLRLSVSQYSLIYLCICVGCCCILAYRWYKCTRS